MKLLTLYTSEGLELAVKTDRGIAGLTAAQAFVAAEERLPQSIDEAIAGGAAALAALERYVRRLEASDDARIWTAEASSRLAPCVPRPGKIICVGLNYRRHAEESNMPIPAYPILFNKFNNSLAGHGEPVGLPADALEMDYEAELAIVIGKEAKAVSRDEALDAVFGYCNANDLSARDLQFRTNQWLLGKTCDGFSPLGPYLVTADEVGNPNALGIRCYVNGELRQSSSTADMIFYCDEIISYISQYITLSPGDVIMTGTPEGVIFGYPKERQVWLEDGDEVTIEIDGLGRLTNRLRRLG